MFRTDKKKSLVMVKYIKTIKQEVDAEQFFAEKHPWPTGVFVEKNSKDYRLEMPYGSQSVFDGDWIITPKVGRKEVHSPETFKRQFVKPERNGG